MKKASDVFKVGENKIGWVDSDFTREYGNDEMPEFGAVISFQKLTKSMKDSEIIKELGVQECTLGDVLATLNSATDDMKDGYANIFYIKGHPSRVVRVGWSDVGGGWRVLTWRRDVRDWLDGIRVFSPATVSGSVSTLSSDSLTLDQAIQIVKAAGLKVIKTITTEVEL